MTTATLGGLIKDYRIKKRLSQIDVSLKLGWKDTSRLSKIEQGRVGKPNRDTTERIMNALELTQQERGNFLLVGGYLPTDDEIQPIIKLVKTKINTWKYPSYLVDFSLRWIYANDAALIVGDLPLEQKAWMEKIKPHFLSIAFLPKDQLSVEIKKGESEETLTSFKIGQIATFKNENEKYQNESWYKKLLKEMMKNEEFRSLWPKVDSEISYKTLFDYEYITFTGTYNGKVKTLKFHLTASKIIRDIRFRVVFYFPADKATEEFFSNN